MNQRPQHGRHWTGLLALAMCVAGVTVEAAEDYATGANEMQPASMIPLEEVDMTDPVPPTGITESPDAAALEHPPRAPEAGRLQALSQAKRLQKIVDLSFTNADLKSVLNSLAKTYQLNIVADDTVTGTVTLTLRQISLTEGLRQILRLNGFAYTLRGEIIEIDKLEDAKMTQLIHLMYLNLDAALEFLQPLASDSGALQADETSNALLVSDYVTNIEAMRDALRQVDVAPQQVLIESKLMDITHTDLDNLGLSLSSIASTIPLHGGAGRLPLLISSAALSLAGTSSDLPGDEITMTVARGDDTITSVIDALIRDRRVKVIATPTILTVNNVEAKITIGEKFPIREQTQTTTGTLETTRFVDIGTTLRVTPRINRDGVIQMHIHPEVSSVSATLDEGPRITTREADTSVLIRDGQPIIIAGLIQEDETLIQGRVPVLGHIPFVGLLFRNRSKDHEQKELVIMITPHIIGLGAQAASTASVQEVGDRFEITELFEQARALEDRVTLQARKSRDVVRYYQAIDLYERVAQRFPDHPYAQEALLRTARIFRTELADIDAAESAYRRLLLRYPDGLYRQEAEQMSRRLRQLQRKLERRRSGAAIRAQDRVSSR